MGRRVVVTGSSRGLGLALSQHLVDQGDRVWGISRSRPQWEHPQYGHICADLTKPETILEAYAGIKAETAAIDVLINNAGTARMNYLLSVGMGEIEDSFAINAAAPINCLRVFARLMVRGGGHVVNISSIASAANFTGTVGYAAAKAALDKVTKLAAMELAPYKVMVNGLSLPPMQVGLGEHMREEDRQKGLEKTVLGRAIALEEVMHSIDYLCAPGNTYLSGETLHLGGLV